MYAPKSPLRKAPSHSSAPWAYQSQARVNGSDSTVNPIPILVGKIRTAADEYTSSSSHAEDLSRHLVMLSNFYFTPKLPEAVSYNSNSRRFYPLFLNVIAQLFLHLQDIASLIELIGSLGSLPLTLLDVGNIARFVSRSSRTELPNAAMFKVAGMQNVFELLLSDLCRTLQPESIVETHEHVCDILLGLSCIFQYSGCCGWLGQYRLYSLRTLLLLHSLTLGLPQLRETNNHITQLKLQASAIEALGFAYSVTSDSKIIIDTNMDNISREALMAQLTSIFPGAGGSESKLTAQVLELLVASVHTSQLYIKALPTTAALPSVLSETPAAIDASKSNVIATVIYHTTTAQLALLTAALRAAHLVFDAAHTAAKATAKKSGTKAVSGLVLRLNQRNSLLTSVESLLKDSVGLLAKRLALVAESYAQSNNNAGVQGAGVTDGTPLHSNANISNNNSPDTNNATPSSAAKTSAFVKAAYRPPSQRTGAPPGIITPTTAPNTAGATSNPSAFANNTALATPPGFTTTTNSSANTNALSAKSGITSTAGATSLKALQVLREKVTQMGLTFLGSLAAHDPGTILYL